MKFEKTWVSKIPDLGILDNLKKPDIRNNFKKDLGIHNNFKKDLGILDDSDEAIAGAHS